MPRSALLLGGLALGAGLVYGLLGRAPRRDPRAQAALERAVAAVDRELAGNLEMTTMFDQTRQAVVLENGEFALYREVIERELPADYRGLARLYDALPGAESAMERRGPAGSVTPSDRATVEGWEGDAREAQRLLRRALTAPPLPAWRRPAATLVAMLVRAPTAGSGPVARTAPSHDTPPRADARQAPGR